MSSASVIDFDANPALAAAYACGPYLFIPGYAALHRLVAVRFADVLPPSARILVVGAGGGVELCELTTVSPNWSMFGVDPSAEMLGIARQRVDNAGAGGRVELRQGFVAEAPDTAFCAATSILTMHFMPDDGSKLAYLREVRRRLKSGAPFAIVDGCADKLAHNWEKSVRLYIEHARRNGAEQELIDRATEMLPSMHFIPPDREERLLEEAGFKEIERFYQGLWFFGWFARA